MVGYGTLKPFSKVGGRDTRGMFPRGEGCPVIILWHHTQIRWLGSDTRRRCPGSSQAFIQPAILLLILLWKETKRKRKLRLPS